MTAINQVVDLSMTGDIAVVTVDHPPVNALSPEVLDGLYDAFLRAIDDPAAKAIVLICAGRTFIAGADINFLGGGTPMAKVFECQDRIESAAKPVVAAIHGTCLGGGLEVALTCHYRIAVPSARLGLPEVNLGLPPGGGGTQRLPRVTGIPAALELLISGRQISAQDALHRGIIDEIVQGKDLRAEAIAYARRLVAESRPPRRVRDLTDRIGGASPAVFTFARSEAAKKRRGETAPEAIIRCIEAAAKGDFDAGLAVERVEFQAALKGPQFPALRHIFLAERQTGKVDGIGPEVAPLPVGKVGVIGAGTMGGGIAMNFLNIGTQVTLVETRREALDRGLATIAGNYVSAVAKGKLTEADAAKRQALLKPTLDIAEVADCDLIIEAVFEDMGVKKQVFARLDEAAKPSAILATNTSFLDINEIASATGRPERVLGLHFFSPANVMRLLEVVRGDRTASEVIVTAMALARSIRKVPVLSGVCHGFIGNRMLLTRQAQADRMLLEGIPPQDVDRVIYEFGFPMGPFAMLDMAGLDIGWSPETSRGETVRDRLCEEGRKGQKTGAGYYDYDANRRPAPSPVTAAIIAERAKAAGVEQRAASDDDILTRLLYPMINEGARILEEGIAQRASDIDIVWVMGYGWPAWRGGPIYYADSIGLDRVITGLKAMGVEPARLLLERAAAGKGLAG